MKADLLILDGRHLLWRTSDAFRQLMVEREDGTYMLTGGMYGFLTVALRVYNKFGGTVVVAWEGRTNWRTEVFPHYKNRDGERTPEQQELINDMIEQEHRLILLLSTMGIRQYRGVNSEADDVIGRLATHAAARDKHVIIYTGDSDLRQLVTSRILVAAPVKGKDVLYDVGAVKEKHGVFPGCLSDLKALAGDASDKIPGVKGIGPKTAAQLINHYGSLVAVMEAAQAKADDWPVAARHMEAVTLCDQLPLFHELTTIDVQAGMKPIRRQRSQRKVIHQFKKYKFRTLAGPSELHDLMRMGG